jgi:hypothetical protein
MHKHDKVFWMLFVLLELAIIMGNIWAFTPIGAILGFVLIGVAFARFGDYILHKERTAQMKSHNNAIERMKSWLNNQYELTQGIKELHDYRFHKLESKKIEIDENVERKYRELVGKIIDVENRLNLVSRAVIAQRQQPVATPITAEVPKMVEKPLDAFENVWEALTGLAERKGHVNTLSRNVKNKVMDVGTNAIKLKSELTKKERVILKEEFRHFWDILKKKGKLDFTKDVDDPKLVRLGSIIISFLARLPNVEHDLKPRMLYIMEHNTHTLGTLKRHRKRI